MEKSKKTKAVVVSIKEAIKAADNYRSTTLQIEKIAAEIQNKQAMVANEREEELLDLVAIQKQSEDMLKLYVDANSQYLLKEGRSTSFAGVKLGYRKSTPKLVTLGENNWERVLEMLNANVKLRYLYVKTQQVVDKNLLKSAEPEVLKDLGLSVEESDNFFVKL